MPPYTTFQILFTNNKSDFISVSLDVIWISYPEYGPDYPPKLNDFLLWSFPLNSQNFIKIEQLVSE